MEFRNIHCAISLTSNIEGTQKSAARLRAATAHVKQQTYLNLNSSIVIIFTSISMAVSRGLLIDQNSCSFRSSPYPLLELRVNQHAI